jgi:transcriptional regulator
MYNPIHFRVADTEALLAFLVAHPLATLVRAPGGTLDADHLPMLVRRDANGHCTLCGHVARANPLWRDCPAGSDVLAIFHGPGAYVSPGWYPSKRQHGRVVPTWNYSVVHARGTIRFVEDESWLRALVAELTIRHEAQRGQPWRIEDAPPPYLEAMLRGIVGVEIEVAALEGKAKASQNREATDRAGVREGLRGEGFDERALADLVRDRETHSRDDG